jgi:hypothetical protein
VLGTVLAPIGSLELIVFFPTVKHLILMLDTNLKLYSMTHQEKPYNNPIALQSTNRWLLPYEPDVHRRTQKYLYARGCIRK